MCIHCLIAIPKSVIQNLEHSIIIIVYRQRDCESTVEIALKLNIIMVTMVKVISSYNDISLL